ncbi:hypothetical protein [Oleispirillum naphthae]|uniref:hypothetical protein n=1 Tax=Oleispirillum naphthae TaxID=2838853 RepID=UPI0030826340
MSFLSILSVLFDYCLRSAIGTDGGVRSILRRTSPRRSFSPLHGAAVRREALLHVRRVRVVRVGFQALCQLGGEVIQVVQVLFHAVIIAAGVKPRHAIRIGSVA